jgi:hypothetical protein
MPSARVAVGFLSIGYLAAACGEGPPPRYPLPANALAGPSLKAHVGEAVDITMQPITARTLSRHPSLGVRVRWHEPPVPPTLRPDSGRLHERVAAVVPLPALWMDIENHGVGTVRFGCSTLAMTTRDGKSWPIVLDRAEVERLAVERLLAEERTLTMLTPEAVRALERDPLAVHPLSALREAVARAPLLDASVEVPPGGHWQGAVVFDVSSEDVAALEDVVGGAQLDVKLACATMDETPLEPATFSFRLVPARETNGACIEEADGGRYRLTRSYMDGRRAANIDVANALVAQPVSREAGTKAMALRGVGIAAIAAGIIGAVVTSAALGSTGHPNEAPAGLSMLGLSIGGGVMTWFGYRKHTEAVSRYNAHAAATGLCPRPN